MRLRFPAPRLVVGLTVLALLLIDLHALMSTLQAHRAVRERAFRAVEGRMIAARPLLATLLGTSGTGAAERVLEQVLSSGLGTAAEIRSLDGQRLVVLPRAAPPPTLAPALASADQILAGRVVLSGSVLGGSVVAEMTLRPPPETVLLAVTVPVPDVVLDLQERREIFLGQGLTLLLLIVLGVAALLPTGDAAESTPAHALLAYEAAMERLRTRGEEQSMRHAEERQRLFDEAQGREALARAGELTAGIVHEVRNGLGTLLGYARLLEKIPHPEAQAHGHSIREECETLETVVRRFMEFVKTERLSPLSFDLGRMLERVASRESRSRAGATVEIRGEGGTLVADEELLERAFENLVRNAREAAGTSGHVLVETSRANGFVSVVVRDDGPGLDPETRERLRPFFTTKVGGLGLGLPIALKIVLLHHGDLAFSDRSPRGLTVTVLLPEVAAVDEGRYDT